MSQPLLTERPEDDEDFWEDRSSDLSRILALSDGVFGFALTLLATGMVVPELVGEDVAARLAEEIRSIVPQFVVFALTFYVIVFKWTVHRRMFNAITRCDGTLIWLNNALLLMIAFLPVPSKILIEYPTQVAAIIFFAVAHLVTTATQAAIYAYATRGHRLVNPGIDKAMIRYHRQVHLTLIGAMALSIGVAVVSPAAAFAVWLAAFGINFLFALRRRRERRRMHAK